MPASTSSPTLSLVCHAAALVVVYSLYSLLQEKIMKKPYGPEGAERFTSASLVVLSNRLCSLLAGVAFTLCLPAPTTERIGSSDDIGEKSPILPTRPSPLRSGPTADSTSPSRSLMRPTWPLWSYAVVAAANFVSTYCQYDALRYVGFTTQALAKCAKMVPVLFLGRVVYRKTYKQKEYVAGAVVLLGCFVYLVSLPQSASPAQHVQFPADSPAASEAIPTPYAPLIGGVLLASYLLFDGLTSTTQEYCFGKKSKNGQKKIAPLTPGGPVLDQMVYVNLCASIISLILCASNGSTTLRNLELAFSDRQLMFDIALLSATATFGLVVLYDTIFKHGALTVATTMTLRQFFSILLNAGIFGNFSSIGTGGWLGVGFVAAGVCIKMARRFDAPASPLSTSEHDGTDHKGDDVQSSLPVYATPEHESGRRAHRLAQQYGVPLSLPFLFVAIGKAFAA